MTLIIALLFVLTGLVLTGLVSAGNDDGFYSLNAKSLNYNNTPLSSFKGNVMKPAS